MSLISMTAVQLGGIIVGLRDLAAETLLFTSMGNGWKLLLGESAQFLILTFL